MNVSEFIVKKLESLGITNTCIVSGGGMMFLTEALKNSKIKCLFNHNEQCSAFAAEAMSRFSKKISVCFATSGPGSTNILTGITSAFQESAPVIFITGQSKSNQTILGSKNYRLRQYGTFEVNSSRLTQTVTKYSKTILDPYQIKYELEKSIHIALNDRPGPVHLDLPLDIQSYLISKKKLRSYKIKLNKNKYKISSKDLNSIIDKLNSSKKPLFLLGQGSNNQYSKENLLSIFSDIKIPIVTTHIAKDVLYYNHNNFIGHPGPKGDRAGNFAVSNADLIIVLGSSLHSQTIGWNEKEFAKKAYKIHIDPDKSILIKSKKIVNKQINSLSEYFFYNLKQKKNKIKCHSIWLNQCKNFKKKHPVINEPHLRKKDKINYYDLVEQISLNSLRNSTFVSGSGLGWYVTGQGLKLKRNQRFISSSSFGAMGYELPAANGISLINKYQTVCILGDGSLMTNLHDLSMTKIANKNIKIFVYNNNGYTSIRNTQKNFFKKPYIGTDLSTGISIPNIKIIAQLFKLKYAYISNLSELKKNIKKYLSSKKPLIIEVNGLKEQDIIPTVFTRKNDKGEMVSTNLDEMHPSI